jgi:hypothetical protein
MGYTHYFYLMLASTYRSLLRPKLVQHYGLSLWDRIHANNIKTNSTQRLYD